MFARYAVRQLRGKVDGKGTTLLGTSPQLASEAYGSPPLEVHPLSGGTVDC